MARSAEQRTRSQCAHGDIEELAGATRRKQPARGEHEQRAVVRIVGQGGECRLEPRGGARDCGQRAGAAVLHPGCAWRERDGAVEGRERRARPVDFEQCFAEAETGRKAGAARGGAFERRDALVEFLGREQRPAEREQQPCVLRRACHAEPQHRQPVTGGEIRGGGRIEPVHAVCAVAAI